MHAIGNIGSFTPAPPPGMGSNASGGGMGFQMSLTMPGAPAPPPAMGMTSQLGPQTISTLLQTQDLSQPHGHGGGHHSLNLLKESVLAEAEEAETAASSQARKKLKTANVTDVAETEEADEEQPETGDEEKADAQ